MNKAELVNTMAASCAFSKKDCETMLDAFTKIVEKALKDNDTVKLVGFGSFEVKPRSNNIGKGGYKLRPTGMEVSQNTI